MHQNNFKKGEFKSMRIIRMETQFRVSSFVCFSHEFVHWREEISFAAHQTKPPAEKVEYR